MMVIGPDEFDYYVILNTEAGDIQIELLDDSAPTAANNLCVWRELVSMMVRCFIGCSREHSFKEGDRSGTGIGGPGYVFEESLPEQYLAGNVAMANNAPDANGSQFFVVLSDLPAETPLDYPVFGQVVSGLEVAESISQGQVEPDMRGENSAPMEP